MKIEIDRSCVLAMDVASHGRGCLPTRRRGVQRRPWHGDRHRPRARGEGHLRDEQLPRGREISRSSRSSGTARRPLSSSALSGGSSPSGRRAEGRRDVEAVAPGLRVARPCRGSALTGAGREPADVCRLNAAGCGLDVRVRTGSRGLLLGRGGCPRAGVAELEARGLPPRRGTGCASTTRACGFASSGGPRGGPRAPSPPADGRRAAARRRGGARPRPATSPHASCPACGAAARGGGDLARRRAGPRLAQRMRGSYLTAAPVPLAAGCWRPSWSGDGCGAGAARPGATEGPERADGRRPQPGLRRRPGLRGRRVVGFVQADCGGARELTTSTGTTSRPWRRGSGWSSSGHRCSSACASSGPVTREVLCARNAAWPGSTTPRRCSCRGTRGRSP